VPETVDLSALRGAGPAEGEILLPEDEPSAPAPVAAAAAPQPDEAIVAALVSMGFSENGSKRAALATNNTGPEPAMEWVFAHMEDPDFNDPIPPPDAAPPTAGGKAEPDPAMIEMLVGMSFTPEQARGALAATDGNLERAADWLFSHMDDLDTAVAQALGGGGGAAPPAEAGAGSAEEPVNDGRGVYDLLGFVSHMGANTACGHYVCHIKKNGKWVLYNDRKVAISETTPLDLGYIYLFQRRDDVAMD